MTALGEEVVSDLGGPTVHIIDRDDSFRDELVTLVQSVGLHTSHHASGKDLLDTLEELSPLGCVVLNVRLPGVSGLEVLRTLRDSGAEIPTIAMSDDTDVELVVEAFRHGATDFLGKPFSDYEFLEAVQDGVALYQQRLNRHRERDAFLAKIARLHHAEKKSSG